MINPALSAALTGLLPVAGAANDETVGVWLADMRDNIQNGHCPDIADDQGPLADPGNGLQAHTCYSPSGETFVDQAFDSEEFAAGTFVMLLRSSRVD